MTDASFWAIVDAARAAATPEHDDLAERLRAELDARSPDEIAAFDATFVRLFDAAYRWDLWAAAAIVEGDPSEETFDEVRAGLLAQGRAVYEAALADPASIGALPRRGVALAQGALLDVAASAYAAKTGAPLPEPPGPRPTEPAGEAWEEDELASRFPELAEAFDYA